MAIRRIKTRSGTRCRDTATNKFVKCPSTRRKKSSRRTSRAKTTSRGQECYSFKIRGNLGPRRRTCRSKRTGKFVSSKRI